MNNSLENGNHEITNGAIKNFDKIDKSFFVPKCLWKPSLKRLTNIEKFKDFVNEKFKKSLSKYSIMTTQFYAIL